VLDLVLGGALHEPNQVVDGISLNNLSITNFLTRDHQPEWSATAAGANTLIVWRRGKTWIAVAIRAVFSWSWLRTKHAVPGLIRPTAAKFLATVFWAARRWSPGGVAVGPSGLAEEPGLIKNHVLFKLAGLSAWHIDLYSLLVWCSWFRPYTTRLKF